MAFNQGSQDDNSLQIIIAVVSIFVTVFILFNIYHENIYTFFMHIAYSELYPWSYVFERAALVRQRIGIVSPSELTFGDIISLLNFSGRFYAMCLLPFVIIIMFKDWRTSVCDTFVRKLGRDSLLKNNVKTMACLAPIVNWRGSLLDEPYDSGPWKTPQQPIQFAVAHGLLVDQDGNPIPADLILNEDNLADPQSPVLSGKPKAHFNREKAHEVFCRQFGPLFRGFHDMPAYLQKLALAFLLFGLDQKDKAQQLLDEMNRSLVWPSMVERKKFHLGWPPFKNCKVNVGYSMNLSLGLSQKKIDQLLETKSVQRAILPHNKYTYLVILALYRFARSKGVLPTSQFLWLRPVNRTLHYLLNNFGRRTVWIECAGPWTHFLAEDQLQKAEPGFRGDSLDTDAKQVLEAVNAAEVAAYEEGWIISLAEVSKAAQQGRLGLSDEDDISLEKIKTKELFNNIGARS